MDEINVTRLKLGSVFKYGYAALSAIFLPLMLLCGLIGFGGGTVVYQNGQPVYGITALLTALVLALIFPAIFAVLLLIGTALLRIVSRWAPNLRTRSD